MKYRVLLATLLLLAAKTSEGQPVTMTSRSETKLFVTSSYAWTGTYEEREVITFLEQVARKAAAPPVLKATVYADRNDAITSETEKGSTDVSRSFWEAECGRRRSRAEAAVQLVRVGARQSIRVFDKNGAREVTKDRSLRLDIRVDGTDLKFLFLGINVDRPMFTVSRESSVALYYGSSGAVDSSTARKLLAQLQLPNGNFDVLVATSPEFIQESSYPFYNRFVRDFACRVPVSSRSHVAWCRKRISKELNCDSW